MTFLTSTKLAEGRTWVGALFLLFPFDWEPSERKARVPTQV